MSLELIPFVIFLGNEAWNEYPTLRMLMEMVMLK